MQPWRVRLVHLGMALAGLFALASAALLYGFLTLPSVADLPARVQATLARHGDHYTPLRDIPVALQEALIATEDERFYQNQGIDLIGLGRAALDDLRAGRVVEGGSTITEQLAKDVYVGNDDTVLRKLETMGLALKIAHRYSKQQVLELYLNRVYLGHGAYGVAAAAETYFDEPVSRLGLAECALLAGLPRAPLWDDPLVHPRQAEYRQAEVLDRMVEQGMISRAEAQQAKWRLQRLLSKTAIG